MKKVIAIVLLSLVAGNSDAQLNRKIKFPSPESATYDNNGNDLRGFINRNKNDFEAKGNKVLDASGNDWGYMQIKNVKTPGEDKKGNLNYLESFDVTLAMMKTKGGAKATWWTREYNSTSGKLLYYKVGEAGLLAYDNVKYTEVITDLLPKSFDIIEYSDTLLNQGDFEILFKNCMFVKNGTIKDVNDYKNLVEFYNTFLAKFTAINDPVIDNKSFITCFSGKSGANYVGCFNIVNGKLSGRVEQVEAPFERDKIKYVNDIFKKLTGSSINVYGDDYFGMEKMMKTRADKSNMKIDFKKTNSRRKYNEDF